MALVTREARLGEPMESESVGGAVGIERAPAGAEVRRNLEEEEKQWAWA